MAQQRQMITTQDKALLLVLKSGPMDKQKKSKRMKSTLMSKFRTHCTIKQSSRHEMKTMYSSDKDLYSSQDDSKVIYISTKKSQLKNLEENINNKTQENFYKFGNENNLVNFLIEFTTNYDANGYFKDFNFYIILDIFKINSSPIKEKIDLIPIKENFLIKGFYSTFTFNTLNQCQWA